MQWIYCPFRILKIPEETYFLQHGKLSARNIYHSVPELETRFNTLHTRLSRKRMFLMNKTTKAFLTGQPNRNLQLLRLFMVQGQLTTGDTSPHRLKETLTYCYARSQGP